MIRFLILGILGGTGMAEIVILGIILAMFVLPIVAIVKLMANNSIVGGNRVAWVLVILFVPILGAIIYLMSAQKTI